MADGNDPVELKVVGDGLEVVELLLEAVLVFVGLVGSAEAQEVERDHPSPSAA